MRRAAWIALAVVWAPASAAARDEIDEAGPRAQVIRAVERGPFAQLDVGYSHIVNEVGGVSVGPGAALGAWIGYDLTPILSLSLGGTAVTAFSTSDDPTGGSDLLYLSPMARLQLALLSSQRDFLWVRAEGGVAFSLPDEIGGQSFGGVGPVVGGAVVFEHFTKLRHFSIGLSLGPTFYFEPDVAVSVQVLPLVKYTF